MPFGTQDITYLNGAWTYAAQPASLEDIMVEWQLRQYFSLALASLTNTQTLVWYTSFQDPKWANATVQDFLKTLTGFKHFKVNIRRGLSADLSLEFVHDLTKLAVLGVSRRDRRAVQDQIAGIIAASPALHRLDIDTDPYPSRNDTLSLQQDFLSRVPKEIILPITRLNVRRLRVSFDDEIIRHFRSLKSFNICLKKISASNARGLFHVIARQRLAGDFYARVLPKHCESLENLELRPTMPSAWCFSDSLHHHFEPCQRLKELAVTLNFSASNIDDMSGLNMVKRTTSTLPLLERLTVYAIDNWDSVRELTPNSSITP
ncbi:hypothetical protein BDQ12DRAFT_712261 [Crucibulum laeve]|uniref:F-box domain-containing protein n=1 Tax=Crucibulum laeve TaxID=68775 RepID=A0A5C3M4G5_9AGAR|nr:hypothetical protein BDQ12DRAFT_712261 [Crucibulum laeve]